MKKVLFVIGGRSGEHEISLISGKHLLKALDRKLFEPLLMIIQKDGVMTLGKESDLEVLSDNPKKVKTPQGVQVSIRPYKLNGKQPALIAGDKVYEFDLAFPILHGPGGEDGTIQGLFELSEIPVVGCGVRASAICMDKGLTKRICMQARLPVVPFEEIYREDFVKRNEAKELPWPFPVFVKPANLGSSLGVSKVNSETELKSALDSAFKLDDKVLVEPAISGRELEIAILGKRGELIASPAGEVRCRPGEFYSYDAKYVDPDAAEILIPTKLSDQELKDIQQISKNIFNALQCHGMARIDFFMNENGAFLMNEVNTIPGFTPISMYPKLMGLAGVSYKDLITRLIELAN
ncbi:MAG: D-alanine--D-alanine ligase [Deltaproteobacteria bacterium]|nr:D-alanine--D-alanine ligase [Deltaproteobacteria bacterium]